MSTYRIVLAALAATVAFPGAAQAAPASVEAAARLTAQAHVESVQAARLVAHARRAGDRGVAAARRIRARTEARALAALARSRRSIERAGALAARTVATSPPEVAASAAATFSVALVRDTRDLARIARTPGAPGRAAASAIGADAQLRVRITAGLLARAQADAGASTAASQAAVAAHADDLAAARVLAERLRSESDRRLRCALRRAADVQLRARAALERAVRRLAEQGTAQAQAAHEEVADGTAVEARLMADAQTDRGSSADANGSGRGPLLGVGLSAQVTAGVRS